MQEFFPKSLIALIVCILISACKEEKNSLQGYVDADYTYVSSSFSGNLISLDIAKGNPVHKGDLLFTLDVQPQKSQLKKAKANLTQTLAVAKLKQSALEYQSNLLKRYQKLLASGGVSREEFEEVKHNYQNAKAELIAQEAVVESSTAEFSEAQWGESNKKMYSSISGYIYDTYFTVGELVIKERPVLSIVAPENLKVIFYVPEPLLAKLKLKNQIMISCDGCKKIYPATVSYISSKTEYTPPYIFSETSRTKFVYRIEARPVKTAFNFLHPGQPVSINLNL
ncbi:HlyD family secretion protein [Legionella longbeachae]|uniref:HlyD family secretion protein n=1 Tax=Legionella longbeachae TaxID=450 RepID=UPI00124646A5|nr:HlyD family efflux transporter periplasmic adaptor subunit [Legionella longbeachae]QEY52142.1 HlyD family efflux transporter periplasmic adaptor subunit [Legionella longbeachae]